MSENIQTVLLLLIFAAVYLLLGPGVAFWLSIATFIAALLFYFLVARPGVMSQSPPRTEV